jgi:hypothetical protein
LLPCTDIDDGWDVAGPLSNNHGPSEIDANWQSDMGLSASDLADITSGFRWIADRVYGALLERGKFAWNQVRCHTNAAVSVWEIDNMFSIHAQFLNNDPNCPVSSPSLC